jgi:ataxia telangiectasia mutated family protein
MKKPADYGEVESVEDNIDENLLEVKDPPSMDLFNDYTANSMSDANDSGESQSTVGKYVLTARNFCYLFLKKKIAMN